MSAPGWEGRVRLPAVAGSFYAGSADRLAGDVDALLAEGRARAPSLGDRRVRGVITPHAGYLYSGPIAGSAYAALSSAAPAPSSATPAPSRLVILGPSHFVPLRGMAVSAQAAWRTPLGDVAVDAAAREALLAAGAVVDESVHRSEHSIEVQLPFLQRSFPGVPVLPVAVGEGEPERGAALLEAIMGDAAVLVVSTDLSHYHDAASARRLDARTAAAIEALDIAGLQPADACGFAGLRMGLAWARRRGYGIRLLDLRDSAHTAGDPSRVVGYGAFAIVEDG